MKNLNEIPIETQQADERGYEMFNELLWGSSEVCNSCFSQVRTVGDEITRPLETHDERPLEYGPPISLTINAWYDRTEDGSQEHTTWDHNKRFGTCYCLKCGTDCNGNHRNKSIQELKPLMQNILRYVNTQTPHELDARRFAEEVVRLKRERSAQGHETEVLGLAFARAFTRSTDAEAASAQVAAD